MTAQQDTLAQLTEMGVSIWLDDINRERLSTGNLAALMRDFHVRGVTSNPTIFAKAMSNGSAYAEQMADLALRGVDVGEATRSLTTYDIRWACDVPAARLRRQPSRTASTAASRSRVDPRLARETAKTIAEARALWWMVDRPNLFIKIPATVEGLPAITQCLSEGISVNVTLIFSLERYGQVIDAFTAGLEAGIGPGCLSSIASVASFFVSRVDTEVDEQARQDRHAQGAEALRGKAALANARLAYELFEQRSATPRWAALKARGARSQRPLWASTSVKDPSFADTMYVTELAAPGTVNTMPEATIRATADHARLHGDAIPQRHLRRVQTRIRAA